MSKSTVGMIVLLVILIGGGAIWYKTKGPGRYIPPNAGFPLPEQMASTTQQ